MKKRGCLQGVGSPSSFISSFLHLFVFVACLFLFSFEEQLRRTYWLEIYLIKGAKYEKNILFIIVSMGRCIDFTAMPECSSGEKSEIRFLFYR